MAVVDEGVLVDPACAGCVRTNGGMHVCWQAPCDLLQILQDARARPIEIRSVLEDDEDVGIAEHRLRAHCFDMRRGQQSRDDRIGNLVLDDVGWLTCPRRVDDDLHVGDIRQGIERNVAQSPDSREHKQQRSRENEEAISRAPVDPSGDHVTSLPWRSR